MDSQESPSEMQNRHRTEQKNLQARIMQKKKGATKKTRRGIASECEELQLQLCRKQEQERANSNDNKDQATNPCGHISVESHSIDLLKDEPIETKPTVDDITQALNTCSLVPESMPLSGVPVKKRNRQKERLARRAAENEAAIEEAKREVANQPDIKSIERKIIMNQCAAKGLTEKLIRPDGHCLFSAIADQLTQIGIPLSGEANYQPEDQLYKIVREAAAIYLEEHSDDFLAWLDEPLCQYVEKIKNTAEWGGHLELLALARNYNVKICVIQDGALQTIDPLPDETKKPQEIWVAYYRHGFGLGEHYNSLRKES
ncbi:hypothetical protein Golomagni_02135 [Golovinomyces magnicellulatus]|nr:hypothetical protein Golomagni_02135 [Golovinomyces magnicellulatus]